MEVKTTGIIRDLIISLLIVICLALIVSVFFYDKISLGRVIPESEDYMLTQEMQDELEESIQNSTEEVIINYQIDALDLNEYEKDNQYNKGKSNPFQMLDSGVVGNTSTDSNLSVNTPSENSSENFYEDDGTK